jgi:hypothetical protein
MVIFSPASPEDGERVSQDSEDLAVQGTLEEKVMETTSPAVGIVAVVAELSVTAGSTFGLVQDAARAASTMVVRTRILFIVLWN